MAEGAQEDSEQAAEPVWEATPPRYHFSTERRNQ